ncbi:manganese ion binding protein [Aureococcus anophagefferens]|nr:manganese ion binding protein [Aureococcus anophagefferens]
MLAADSHLGYLDRDPVRGGDSFAAFEEVPLGVLRPRRFSRDFDRVLSDQAANFAAGRVNFEDPHAAVALPVFAVHGNHDDPTRDGGVDALAALDNRDAGRGRNACVHESMIPEWFDLVVWGHEHECLVEPRESAVGTFRHAAGSGAATAPARARRSGRFEATGTPTRASRATVERTARRRSGAGPIAALLAERGARRARAPPGPSRAAPQATARRAPSTAACSRSAATSSASSPCASRGAARRRRRRCGPAGAAGGAAAGGGDAAVADALAAEVAALVAAARAAAPPPRFPRMTCPSRRRTRLAARVDRTGFGDVRAARLGARFVGDVANPGTVLHVARAAAGGGGGRCAAAPAPAPRTAKLDAVQIEDLVQGHLDADESKLQVLPEDKMNRALEDFVRKAEGGAFAELVEQELATQKALARAGGPFADEAAVRDAARGAAPAAAAAAAAPRRTTAAAPWRSRGASAA